MKKFIAIACIMLAFTACKKDGKADATKKAADTKKAAEKKAADTKKEAEKK